MITSSTKLMWLVIGALGLFVFFQGNGPSESTVEKQYTQLIEQQWQQTSARFKEGGLRNAVLLSTYATQLKQLKPELANVAETFLKDATPEGALFTELDKRVQTALKDKKSFPNSEAYLKELQTLAQDTREDVLNARLIDSVNILADLSGGTLSRIGGTKTASANATPQDAANKLVGNPNYGQWVERGGMSIWEWYGAYALFRDLLGGRSVNYNDWRNSGGGFFGGDNYYNNQRRYSNDNYPNKNPGNYTEQRQRKTYGYGENNTRRSSSYGNRSSNRSFGFSSSPSRRSSSYGRSFRR